MKIISILLLCVMLGFSVAIAQSENPNYDADLAEQLEADNYGMKSYVLAILITGSNTSNDQQARQSAFRGHLDNINQLVDNGKLVVAGPLGQNEHNYRGIFIFDVASIEEAETLLKTDAAISEGYLDADLFEWYGSAALTTYLRDADKIWKVKP